MENKTVNNPDLELLLQELEHKLLTQLERSIQDRFDTLENKVAFQDDTIEQLNDEITTLNLDNALLKRQIKLLADKVKEPKNSVMASESEETPPPHY